MKTYQLNVPRAIKRSQRNRTREIEQNVATTGGPRWERGDSGMVWGRNEDLSGNRAKPTSRANPAPVTPSAFGAGVRIAVRLKSPKADVAPSASAHIINSREK